MKRRTVFVLAVFALLIVGYVFVVSPIAELYNPDDVDTVTYKWVQKIWYNYPAEEHTVRTWVPGRDELLTRKTYPTAWLPGARSETFSVIASILPGGSINNHAPMYGDYWWKIEIWEEGTSNWRTILPTAGGGYDEEYLIDVVTTDNKNGQIGRNHFPNWEKRKEDTTYCDVTQDWYGRDDPTLICTTNELQFCIAGAHTGALRVSLMLEGFKWSDDLLSLDKHCKPIPFVILQDEAYLGPGIGDIAILPNPLAPSGAGLDYWFEEGNELTFEVTTGVDGTEGNNWYVHLYNQYGNSVEGDRVVKEVGGGQFEFPLQLSNNRNHKQFKYTIQDGDFVEGTSNRWFLTLKNSIIKVDEVFYCTLYEGGFADVPGTTEITFTSGDPIDTKYFIGDHIDMTVTATNNENSGRRILGFQLMAYYGNTLPENLIWDQFKEVPYQSGSTYSTTFSITPDRVGQLTIVAWAYDEIMLPGGQDMRGVYIHDDANQDSYTLTIHVVDNMGNGVYGAKAEVYGVGDLITDSQGLAIFSNLPKGRYQISAIKAGLGEDSKVINLDSDKTEKLVLGFALDLIAIGVAILIFAIMALMAWFVPMPPLYKKLLIIVALVLAIIVFMIMSGMIVWLG